MDLTIVVILNLFFQSSDRGQDWIGMPDVAQLVGETTADQDDVEISWSSCCWV
jgi:hypothetical protein